MKNTLITADDDDRNVLYEILSDFDSHGNGSISCDFKIIALRPNHTTDWTEAFEAKPFKMWHPFPQFKIEYNNYTEFLRRNDK